MNELRSKDTTPTFSGMQYLLPIVETVVLSLIGRKKHQNERIDSFLNNYIVHLNPVALMSNAALEDISDMVFRDEEVRDFVFEATFQIQARCEMEADRVITKEAIAEALTRGLKLTEDRSHSLVPEVITSRLLKQSEIYNILLDNAWLVTCLLLNLVNYNDLVKKQVKASA